MSGVYIKGMEMPKDGVYWCEIGVAGEIATITIHGEDRKSFPLVPIPEHGRVIDADKIGLTNFEIILCQKGNPYKNALEMLLKKIENAPTIIPAEECE